MPSLAEIREKLKQKDAENNNYDAALFAFWNLETDTHATVRFLPDGDDTNDFFWQERVMIRLPFSGIKGHDENKQISIQVPCAEMFGLQCPILADVRQWFKGGKELEDMAKKYWKRRSYLFQGFVVDSAMKEDNAPENPIRRFMFGPSIFDKIKSSLMDEDFFGDEMPTDYENGTDFKIVKTKKGEYANYDTSMWLRKSRSLDEAELAAIEEHGLTNLKTFLPKQPDEDHLAAMYEMFEASVENDLYDPDRWSSFYKPFGFESPNSSDSTENDASASKPKPAPKPAPKPTPEPEPTPEPAEESAPEPAANTSSSSSDAKDILAKIRARKAAENQ